MKAIVFDPSRAPHERVRVEERPKPQPRSHEALLRVLIAGVCQTDVELTRGYKDFRGVLGHEFVAVVEQCDSAQRDWLGKRVAGEITIGCGRCRCCQNGLRGHCANRTVLGIRAHDGAFAEYCVLPVENLHCVPDEIPNDAAVWIEPLAAACEILEQRRILPHERVALLGDGKLAFLIAQVLRTTGSDLIVVGNHEAKLKLFERLGLKTRARKSLEEARTEFAHCFDVVVEATGSEFGLPLALQWVRPRGTIVLKSTFHGETRVDLAPLVVNEIQIIGSRCGPFPVAIDLLKRGILDTQSFIGERFPLERGAEALARAGMPGVKKILIDIHAR